MKNKRKNKKRQVDRLIAELVAAKSVYSHPGAPL
jgi:hypothetical protein